MSDTAPKQNRMGIARFYLALGYLIYALLPHFHIINHTHAGGSHFHTSFSTAQVRLANQLADNLSGTPSEKVSTSPVANKAHLPSNLSVTSAGEPVWKSPNPNTGRHGHYFEDPNLAGLASGPPSYPYVALLIPFLMAAYLSPSLRLLRIKTARGPPSLLPV